MAIGALVFSLAAKSDKDKQERLETISTVSATEPNTPETEKMTPKEIAYYTPGWEERQVLHDDIAGLKAELLKRKSVSEPNTPIVWGQGNPPDNWQFFFGNENIARLNFVQTQMLNKQEKDMVLLIERVRVLENDANTCIANTVSTTTGNPEYCIHNPDPNDTKKEKK